MDFMSIKDISPDQVVFFQWGFVKINATIVFTWAVMLLLLIISIIVGRNVDRQSRTPTRFELLFEIIVDGIKNQIRDISRQEAKQYLPFIGTLFIFVAMCNLLTIIPGYASPTASLSTTAGLAICVFISVPIFGMAKRGFWGYMKQYIKPTVFMLPFNIMGELSRTLALAVRLFGNIMSGGKIVAILLAVIPFIFPVIMQLLGLLTGMIQAYIFAVLAMVYIASATRVQQKQDNKGVSSHG